MNLTQVRKGDCPSISFRLALCQLVAIERVDFQSVVQKDLRPRYRLVLFALEAKPVPKKAAEGEEQPDERKVLAAVCVLLRPQDLATVLKYPFSTGAEQIVLKKLESKTGRKFGGDVWKFVEQADSLGIKDKQQSRTAAVGAGRA